MAIAKEHEIHKRRRGRNIGVGIVLGTFAVLVFALTVAKLKDGEPMQAFDHQLRQDQLEASQ